jgi:cell division protein FtsB
MQKTDQNSPDSFKARYGRSALIIGLTAVFVVTSVGVPRLVVEANSFDAQIRALQDENNDTKAQVKDLKSQAASYQDAIQQFEIQIGGLQAAIAEKCTRQKYQGYVCRR